jgi:hypothetical protein
VSTNVFYEKKRNAISKAKTLALYFFDFSVVTHKTSCLIGFITHGARLLISTLVIFKKQKKCYCNDENILSSTLNKSLEFFFAAMNLR